MRRFRAALRAALAAAVLVGLLAGCTSATKSSGTGASSAADDSTSASAASDLSTLSAAELLARAKAAVNAADQVHLKSASKAGSGEVDFDLGFVKNDATGFLSIGGNKVAILVVAGTTYFKGTDAFWKAQAPTKAAAIITLINGRWIKANPNDSSSSALISLASRKSIVSTYLVPDGSTTKGAAQIINGVECLALQSKDGSLFVAKADARPVEIQRAANQGSLTFSYDGVTIPSVPAASDVIDSGNIGG
jgi:hypothetical protein